jgi:cytochrome c-type biogenesis protein CcmH/NrfG
MTTLVAGGIALIIVCVWWLSRAMSRPVTEDEQRAQHEQFVMARDRLLLELDQLEAAHDNNEIEASLAAQEKLRLETELAQVLRKLERDEGVTTSQAPSRAVRLVIASALALWLPVSAAVLYLSIQGQELLWMAGYSRNDAGMPMNHPSTAAAQVSSPAGGFPPEVMQMVGRLEQRLQQNPEDGEGWKRLGRSYMVMGRHADAVTAYTKAAELLPDDSDIQQALQQLSETVATRDNVGVVQDMPANGQPFPPQVMEMVTRLEQRLQQNPEDGEGWKRLGRSYMVLGRYSEAVSAYTSAAELLPRDKEIQQALQELAAIAAAGNKHPTTDDASEDKMAAHPPLPKGALEQIVALERRVGAQPDDAQAWASLAIAYEGIGRTEDALRAWSEAHTAAPQDVDILAAYAGQLFTSNPRDPRGEALALYRKLHELAPKHPDGLWFLGLAAYSEGNIARTRDFWQELLEVLPPGSEAHESVAEALAGVERLFNTPK